MMMLDRMLRYGARAYDLTPLDTVAKAERVLANVRAIRPFKVRGKLGIFYVELGEIIYQDGVREGRQLLL